MFISAISHLRNAEERLSHIDTCPTIETKSQKQKKPGPSQLFEVMMQIRLQMIIAQTWL